MTLIRSLLILFVVGIALVSCVDRPRRGCRGCPRGKPYGPPLNKPRPRMRDEEQPEDDDEMASDEEEEEEEQNDDDESEERSYKRPSTLPLIKPRERRPWKDLPIRFQRPGPRGNNFD